MAAAILSEFGNDRYIASSAGTFVCGSSPICKDAAFTLESVGIAKYNYIVHRSRPITKELMQENDIIVAMTKGHKNVLCSLFPEYADKITVFSEDIGDFARGDIVKYQLAYVKLKKGIFEMFLSENSK